MSKYIPNTDKQIKEMLSDIGMSDIKDLFSNIPDEVKMNRKLNLPKPMSEMEIESHSRQISGLNRNIKENICFLGAGAYDHYIPSVIPHLLSRQEFYTAYTPYQPEISQGTLQAIFEYQTMICMLTGMDVCNASMYDGATALAEAAALASSSTKRSEILIAKTVHPESREVLKTYSKFNGNTVTEFGYVDGTADILDIKSKLSSNTAAVIIQTPNFFGIIEEMAQIAQMVHENKSLLIVSCDPISLGILKSPGELGADIVVGEGQSLGTPLNFGGPYLGFFAAAKEHMRKMPGRIVGESTDKDGNRGFVLTIQTREQHIRREKATSNICSNEALNALAAAIYLTTMGKQGLRKVATQCVQKSHYAYNQLISTNFFKPVFNSAFFKEFILQYDGNINQLNKKLLNSNILGGYSLSNDYPELKDTWLVAVTEKRTKEDIDLLVEKAVAK